MPGAFARTVSDHHSAQDTMRIASISETVRAKAMHLFAVWHVPKWCIFELSRLTFAHDHNSLCICATDSS
jgi:hypothetical protein